MATWTLKTQHKKNAIETQHWYKDGKEIVSDDRVQANDVKGGVYQLLIKNSRKDDTGIYTCRAENEIGKIVARGKGKYLESGD